MGTPESIILTTQDGLRLAGAYVNADHPRSAALLLHMMPATKESWSAFAFRLSSIGIASLAIDLRGHGASAGGPDGYRGYDEAEHRSSGLDVEAALDWLRGKHPGLHLLGVGASIGANLALRAMADHADLSAVLALSPGLAYHGVTTKDVMPRLHRHQKALLAASCEDGYAAASVEELKTAAQEARVETMIVDGAGHGTAMLVHDPAFADAALAWLSSSI